MMDVIHALDLPTATLVNQRIPKKTLAEHGAVTTVDRRLIESAIAELRWVAALKPSTIGVPAYHDGDRTILEIEVLQLTTRGTLKPANRHRLEELIHRAIPYPVFLVQGEVNSIRVSTAQKRPALNQPDHMVLEEAPEAAVCHERPNADPNVEVFLRAIPLSLQPRTNLAALYQGWTDLVTSFRAARWTGSFRAPVSSAHAMTRRSVLSELETLQTEMERIRSRAAREKQVSRQVELNLTLKNLERRLTEQIQHL